MDRAAVQQKVEWAAEMFGITRLLERKPRQLSGGERQRVALARAVVREPVVFLLDEPLSNLDAKLRIAARDDLKEFQRRLGTTTIYVTHDQIEAMGLGDRIAVLDQGRVRQVDTPAAIYHEPADTFVATFIGAPPMNLVAQGGVILGFRPEHFLPEELRDLGAGGAGRGAEALAFPVRVTRVEYLGADQLIYGVLEAPFPDTHVISRLPWMARFTPAQGERHDFVVREADLKRFEAASGRRVDGAGSG
jgi:multiple sugar transport system ATP-binding protein